MFHNLSFFWFGGVAVCHMYCRISDSSFYSRGQNDISLEECYNKVNSGTTPIHSVSFFFFWDIIINFILDV